MSTASAAVDAVMAAVGDTGGHIKLVGEVICWEMHGAKSLAAVRASLAAAGFDAKKLAPEFKPVNVFARVAEQLERGGRIVKRLRHDETHAHYQFNRSEVTKRDASGESGAAGGAGAAAGDAVNERVEYPFEDIVTLGKTTGEIICKDEAAKAYLEGEMARHRELRTANDVTCIVQRAFDLYGKTSHDADLFPIRSGGAVYFVLSKHAPFLDRVHQFVSEMGGKLTRFPVPVGTDAGNMSVKDTVESGLMSLIHEFDLTVQSLDESSRTGTLEKTARRVDVLREKIGAYETYLGDARLKLLAQVAESDKKLKAKVLELAGRADDEPDDLAASDPAPDASGCDSTDDESAPTVAAV